MINFIGIYLLILDSFVTYKKLIIKKMKLHAPLTHQLP